MYMQNQGFPKSFANVRSLMVASACSLKFITTIADSISIMKKETLTMAENNRRDVVGKGDIRNIKSFKFFGRHLCLPR